MPKIDLSRVEYYACKICRENGFTVLSMREEADSIQVNVANPTMDKTGGCLIPKTQLPKPDLPLLIADRLLTTFRLMDPDFCLPAFAGASLQPPIQWAEAKPWQGKPGKPYPVG